MCVTGFEENRDYFSIQNVFKSSILSRTSIIIISKPMLRPVVTYESEK